MKRPCVANLNTARQLLEHGPETEGRVKFRGDEVQIFSNDRLIAPNSDDTFGAFEPALQEFLTRLYSGSVYTLERESDPMERFSVTAKTAQPVAIDTLLERLAT